MKKKILICGLGKTDVRLSNSNKAILSHGKNVDFKSFVIWVKRMSNSVFEPSSVQSRQFQTLASLTITPPQHMNPVD